MRLKEIYEQIDALAPFSLSAEYCEAYRGYDNSGVQLDCGGEIGKILFSLDLSQKTVERAKAAGAQLVVTHHPAIYTPLKQLFEKEGREILACARAGISVISAHLSLDCAEGGIDESLMIGLGGERALHLMQPLSEGGYGRVFEVGASSFEGFVARAKETFGARRVVAYDGGSNVKRAACFCGGGMEGESVAFALAKGADTYVSSDGKHHLVCAALEGGMNVLLLTHYAAENYGFYRFYMKFKEKSGVPCEYFADERYL